MISIIIPCYNVQETIRENHASIPSIDDNNSGHDLEIVYVDDSSADNTRDILKEIEASDQRVKCIFNEENIGVSGSRNKGINAASGDFILFLDADDVLAKGAIRALSAQMSGDVDFVRGKHYLWEPDGDILRENKDDEKNFQEIYAVSPDQYPAIVSFYTSWNSLFRTEIIRDNGVFFRESVKLGEDRLFNIDYLENCRKITLLNKYTYLWRKPKADTHQATVTLVRDPLEVFRSIRWFAEKTRSSWFDVRAQHRNFLASSMVVELSNFLTSFSKMVDEGSFPDAAHEDICAIFEVLDPDWVDLDISGLKGRSDIFVPLYDITAENLGKAPDSEFYQKFMKRLGLIRKDIAAAQNLQNGLVASRPNETLAQNAYAYARNRLLPGVIGAEESVLTDSTAFDRMYYRQSYPDVASSGLDELQHFLKFGAGEFRNPNPWFDTLRYFNDHPEVLISGLNPLAHYLKNKL